MMYAKFLAWSQEALLLLSFEPHHYCVHRALVFNATHKSCSSHQGGQVGKQTVDTHLRWSTGVWASVWGSLRSGSGIWSACSHCRCRKQKPGQRRRTVLLYPLGLKGDKWRTCSRGKSAVEGFEHKPNQRCASQRRWYECAPTSGHSGRNT